MRHAAHGDLGERLTGRGPERGLTVEGRAQAEALAEQLRNGRIAAVYASPRLRTQQTAEAIAAGRSIPVQTATALDEIDFGDWTGREFVGLDGRPDWNLWNLKRSQARCPGGESMVEAQDRAIAFLQTVNARHDGEQVAIVTHCDIIRALLCWQEGRSLDAILSFEAGPASVTRLSLGGSAKAAA